MDFVLEEFYCFGFICFCLYAMLFWRKKRVGTLTFAHLILVMSLLIGAYNTSDYHIFMKTQSQYEIDLANYDDFMSMLAMALIPFLLGIWKYQWWHIGKARDKYDQNPW
ncbi:MAG: hypothetical protein Q4B88_03630 [Moraxella sp.]|nr:hypothetical protein [Moraxella sp.]